MQSQEYLKMGRAIFAALAVLSFVNSATADTAGTIYKSPSCGCCEKWMQHMKQAGFDLTPKDLGSGELMRQKLKLGISAPQASCHTAQIQGYTVEGHVPAEDVRRLLTEQPDAVGLAVPDMPTGAPGMESGDTKEPFDVLLIRKDGSTEVFAKH